MSGMYRTLLSLHPVGKKKRDINLTDVLWDSLKGSAYMLAFHVTLGYQVENIKNVLIRGTQASNSE